MSPEIDPRKEVLGTGFAFERMFRASTRVGAAFDNALLRQQAHVSYDVKAVSHYENLDHVKDGKMILATWEEAEEWKMLNPDFELTALKKKIRTPVVALYNKAKFGEKFDLTRQRLIDMMNAGDRMSLGATRGASRSAVQIFLARRPEDTPLLREKVQNVPEHPHIAFLGRRFAAEAVAQGYDILFAPAYLARNYYNIDPDRIAMATVNGKEYSDTEYELFHEITHIIHDRKNTKKVKALRNALIDKKLIRALERQFVFPVETS
jgi:hypothetical protein